MFKSSPLWYFCYSSLKGLRQLMHWPLPACSLPQFPPVWALLWTQMGTKTQQAVSQTPGQLTLIRLCQLEALAGLGSEEGRRDPKSCLQFLPPSSRHTGHWGPESSGLLNFQGGASLLAPPPASVVPEKWSSLSSSPSVQVLGSLPLSLQFVLPD